MEGRVGDRGEPKGEGQGVKVTAGVGDVADEGRRERWWVVTEQARRDRGWGGGGHGESREEVRRSQRFESPIQGLLHPCTLPKPVVLPYSLCFRSISKSARNCCVTVVDPRTPPKPVVLPSAAKQQQECATGQADVSFFGKFLVWERASIINSNKSNHFAIKPWACCKCILRASWVRFPERTVRFADTPVTALLVRPMDA